MLEALSIRFCRLIPATDANYSSYVDSGLVCPYCKSSVVYVAGREVIRKKHKSYSTRPYFRHFKDKDGEDCELRIKSNGKPTQTAVRTICRQQRQEKFNDRIEEIIQLNFRFNDYPLVDLLALDNFLGHSDYSKLNQYRRQGVKELKRLRFQVKESMQEILNSIPTIIQDCSTHRYLKYLEDEVELQMHKTICYEILDFLMSPGASKTLMDLFFLFEYEALVYSRFIQESQKSAVLTEEQTIAICEYVARNGIFILQEYTVFEDSINGTISKREEKHSLIAYLMGASIAMAPWNNGFNFFDREQKSNLWFTRSINGCYILNCDNSMTACMAVYRQKSEIKSGIGNVYLSDWLDKKIKNADKKIAKNSDTRFVHITETLPEPYNHIYVFAQIPLNPVQHETVFQLGLLGSSQTIASALFWIFVKNPQRKKLFQRRYGKKIAPCIFDKMLGSPTVLVQSVRDGEIKKLLLKLVNGYIDKLGLVITDPDDFE